MKHAGCVLNSLQVEQNSHFEEGHGRRVAQAEIVLGPHVQEMVQRRLHGIDRAAFVSEVLQERLDQLVARQNL
ncbi:hypothetical protein QQX98_001285 [Neonectria punicea]|uniref:Uncharacterized protein n=1 Tax=Neonectria punicea TaxID=979145 RepID=A0ABR1HP31_9HYPO